MTVVVVEAPERIVSLAEAKRQLRVDGAGQDEQIEALIDVATQSLDGPTGGLGRALGEQVLELRLAGFYCDGRAEIELPFPPLIDIVSVTLDGAGGEETVPSASYGLLAGRYLYPRAGYGWPAVREAGQARIRYRAGWPFNGSSWTGPAPIKHAILMLVTRLFHQRGEDVSSTLAEDRAIRSLLAPYWLMQV